MRQERFAFGRNWASYLRLVNEERIQTAVESLCDMLDVSNLQGKKFLDIGCGSGLFSLAARRLGAKVLSFDFDAESVLCARKLKQLYYANDPDWTIETGSILDDEYMKLLGKHDVVYSWGVLHHTGNMWQAINNASHLVEHGGKLFLSIYNQQGRASKYWYHVKRSYNQWPQPLPMVILFLAFVYLWLPTTIRDFIILKPFATWRQYNNTRGMSPWHDVVDWVGGYPFEVARPEEIFTYLRKRGFVLERLKTCGGGLGCNEFVFTCVK
jgi:2-polyprenyl-3-methyl-5-hydroxy-6-metoxy-1,4-benzoquinol methylase